MRKGMIWRVLAMPRGDKRKEKRSFPNTNVTSILFPDFYCTTHTSINEQSIYQIETYRSYKDDQVSPKMQVCIFSSLGQELLFSTPGPHKIFCYPDIKDMSQCLCRQPS